ncbi:hypothetical protein [Alicyclobacillus sp. ALC3]|nr:hypothetical protein [Alicyclobacillus sp. ALC3]
MPSRLITAERDLLRIRQRLLDQRHTTAAQAIAYAVHTLRRIHR